MSSRRAAIANIECNKVQHAGLWFNKFLLDQSTSLGNDNRTSRQRLVEEVSSIDIPEAYSHYIRRWKDALIRMGVEPRYARAKGRLAVGHGDDSVIETSVSLHHTYGVPVIPGSALKGMTAAYARKYLKNAAWHAPKGGKLGSAYLTMFGSTDQAGYVTFHDAYFDPQYSTGVKAVYQDVITVHHPNYYQGNDPPTDWDSPTPIPTLSASGVYIVALSGPYEEWVDKAYEILGMALDEIGVGAKTSSGYGRMTLSVDPSSPQSYGTVSSADNAVGNMDSVAALDYTNERNRLLNGTPSQGRQRGTVAENRGTFVFVNPAKGGQKVFVHRSDLSDQADFPFYEGQILEYRPGPGRSRGQIQGFEVCVLLQPVR